MHLCKGEGNLTYQVTTVGLALCKVLYMYCNSTASRWYSYSYLHLQGGKRRSDGLSNFCMCDRTEIETRVHGIQNPTHFDSVVFLLRSLSPNLQPDCVRRVEFLGPDPVPLIIRW